MYFEGPMGWKGANFSITNNYEYFSLLDKIRLGEPIVNSGITSDELNQLKISGRLFVVSTANFQVRIMAHLASITDELPQFFKNHFKDLGIEY